MLGGIVDDTGHCIVWGCVTAPLSPHRRLSLDLLQSVLNRFNDAQWIAQMRDAVLV